MRGTSLLSDMATLSGVPEASRANSGRGCYLLLSVKQVLVLILLLFPSHPALSDDSNNSKICVFSKEGKHQLRLNNVALFSALYLNSSRNADATVQR
jgi:hypothetical protein